MEESSPNFHHSHDHHHHHRRHHHVPAEEADHGLLRRPLSSISGNGLCYYNYWIHNNDYSNSGSISRGDEATDKPMSEFSFPKSAEPLTSTTLGFAELHLGPSLAEGKDHGDNHTRVLREKLMLKTSFVEKREDCYDHGDSLMVSRDYPGIFGHVYPSMDFSKDQRSAAVLLDCYEASASAPAAFNFLREKNSPRLNDDSGEIASDDNTLGLVRGNLPLDPHDVLSPSTRHRRTEIAASSFAGKKSQSDSKRPNYSPEEKVDGEAAPKKKKVEATPPWKARKEKLGDKVAALQQLVAPFGKTDTASVLMEAIGYIKFLQSQVLTLCVPYMKSSKEEDVGPPSRAGLQPRGLCLVPLSCMTLVPSDEAGDGGGGGFWPPVPYYGGS